MTTRPVQSVSPPLPPRSKPREEALVKSRWLRQLFVSLLAVGGIALIVALVRREGASQVLSAIRVAGWGIVAVIAFHLIPLVMDALSWRSLFPSPRPKFFQMFWMRSIGETVSALLPTAQVGGHIARARLAAIRGVPVAIAVATVMVDLTLSVVTQIIFTVGGLLLLAHVTGHAIRIGPIVDGGLIALAIIFAFYAVQRSGIFRMMARVITRLVSSGELRAFAQGGDALDAELRSLYTRRSRLILSSSWSMLSWIAGAGEVWIAMRLLHLNGGFIDALILESVGQGIRAVVFLVPGALGVQEGGYLIVGALLGIAQHAALALSLIRRARELVFGIPGLITWQWIEGSRLWHARPKAAE